MKPVVPLTEIQEYRLKMLAGLVEETQKANESAMVLYEGLRPIMQNENYPGMAHAAYTMIRLEIEQIEALYGLELLQATKDREEAARAARALRIFEGKQREEKYEQQKAAKAG